MIRRLDKTKGGNDAIFLLGVSQKIHKTIKVGRDVIKIKWNN